MGTWENDIWVWDLKWSCTLSARNKEAFDLLMNTIGRHLPSQTGQDVWSWKHSPTPLPLHTIYSLSRKRVNTAYSEPEVLAFKRLWSGWSPRKTISSAWKLTTIENLRKRGVNIGGTDAICKLCQQDRRRKTRDIFSSLPKLLPMCGMKFSSGSD